MPLDDANDEGCGKRPDPTQIHASIDGNQLSVGADADMPAYVEVIDEETGEVEKKKSLRGKSTSLSGRLLRSWENGFDSNKGAENSAPFFRKAGDRYAKTYNCNRGSP